MHTEGSKNSYQRVVIPLSDAAQCVELSKVYRGVAGQRLALSRLTLGIPPRQVTCSFLYQHFRRLTHGTSQHRGRRFRRRKSTARSHGRLPCVKHQRISERPIRNESRFIIYCSGVRCHDGDATCKPPYSQFSKWYLHTGYASPKIRPSESESWNGNESVHCWTSPFSIFTTNGI